MTSVLDDNENAKFELTAILGQAVAASVYVARGQRISARAIGRAYRSRRWGDNTWLFLHSAHRRTPADAIGAFADALRPFLVQYLEPTTDRVGNGLFSLMGGLGRLRKPTVPEFAEVLLEGAVKLGAARVVDLLFGWIAGEPLRFRSCALLDGVTIDRPLGLDEGVCLEKLPSSSADLPPSLPAFDVSAPDLLDGVVLSVDCQMTPSLYVPEQGDGGPRSGLGRTVTEASDKVPDLSPDSFCESMSLACGGWVGWWRAWRDYGELEAFSLGISGGTLKPRAGFEQTAFTQADLERARAIHLTRHDRPSRSDRKELDQAISRWMKSKRSSEDADRLIELRIALEALYGKGARNEIAFRVSTYGAWHLGGTVDERRKVWETFRKAYADASRAVHAGDLRYTKQDSQLLPTAQAYCLRGILKRLEEPGAPVWDELILG